MGRDEDVRAIREMDPSDGDAVGALLAGDCVYHEDPHWLDGRTFTGREEVVAILNEYVEVWGTKSQTVEWVEAVDGGALAGIRQRGETPQGQMPIDQLWTYLFRMREGAIAEMWAFADEDEARRKAGELAKPAS